MFIACMLIKKERVVTSFNCTFLSTLLELSAKLIEISLSIISVNKIDHQYISTYCKTVVRKNLNYNSFVLFQYVLSIFNDE